VQPKNVDNQNFGAPLVVADPHNLGTVGDLVVYVTSTDATQVFKNGYAPVNASVVELVDEIS
jgi:microcompartment protein CcmK/EutM